MVTKRFNWLSAYHDLCQVEAREGWNPQYFLGRWERGTGCFFFFFLGKGAVNQVDFGVDGFNSFPGKRRVRIIWLDFRGNKFEVRPMASDRRSKATKVSTL